ncbi:hypothetical protein [Tenacibaculum maritimum]|uniref:Uncharacterized protein n=1 Tax=Tenacibaculum maritimum NCIMB 2154 TaxID=1349785 RepID=A0A2H1E9I1_9FLAO|nr:hypothetical protein [Tenacibaculum maritimum]MCD9564033.1 hypothetical protein [Tenacibaculum maritimum]MCD9564390.1 hypothetical protein [Tenacibaculum maritimum]MCD9578258.1 hypothetical protein [Tenacibaculum maritimum]MCD9582098.1 hypothetical protein [Tenacibaculum maritimum]MCD9584487.1 hypothetical protein [Tenacibaculum maritimum]
MELNFTLLETKAACDAAIETTQSEKTLLERRLRNLGESLTDKELRTQRVQEGIISVKAIITGFESALGVITDEKEKRSLELKIEREETKLKALENRNANYSAVNVIEDQIDHQQLEAQVAILNTALNEIAAHKETLTV